MNIHLHRTMKAMDRLLLIMLLLIPLCVDAQTSTTVTGSIEDSRGEPLAEVTVMRRGTPNGTVTGLDGQLSAQVPAGVMLVFRYVGFDESELKAATNMAVTLKSNVRAADKVMAVGYGLQKKANLTGSVSQAKMSDVLSDRPVVNAAAALQEAMPGLTIGGGSGPGYSKSLDVRGALSINGGGPLVLIDNIEGDLSTLDPEDTESVAVLKDAVSSAIRGARTVGGVILVILRHPKNDARFTANYNSSLGWKQPLNYLEQTSLIQCLDAYLEVGYSNFYWAGNGGVSKRCDYLQKYQADPSSAVAVDDGTFKDTDGRVYWLPEKNLAESILTTSSITNHNLTISGETGKIRYRVPGSLSRENGPLVTDKDMFRRKTISGLVSADLQKWFT